MKSLKNLIAYVKRQILDYWIVLLICPALFLYILSNDINLIALNGLVLRKICLSQFNDTICNYLKNHTLQSNLVQEKTSNEIMLLNISFMVPAVFAIIHLAGSADRKLNYRGPLFVSVIGCLLQTIICIFATQQTSKLSIGLLYLSQVVNGVFGGGSLAFISACFSHIAVNEQKIDELKSALVNDDTEEDIDKKQRSIRFSLCESCLLLGQFLGSLFSGYLIGNKIDIGNFQRTYIVSLVIYLIVFIYLIFMFKFLKTKFNSNEQMLDNRFNFHKIKQHLAKFSFFSFFNLKNEFSFVRDAFDILFKKRNNNARFHILSLLVVYFLGASISLGISSIQYLYLIKEPISLSQVDYGIFKAFNVITRAFSLLVILPVLKYLSLPDYYLYLIGLASELLNLVVYALASQSPNVIWTGSF